MSMVISSSNVVTGVRRLIIGDRLTIRLQLASHTGSFKPVRYP